VVVVLTGEAVGDALASAEFSGDADANGFGVGDPLASGVAAGVGVALGIVGVAAEVALLFEFRFDCAGERVFVPAATFLGPLLRLIDSALRLESSALGRVASRLRLDAKLGDPPGTVTTTSSLFARCSTWAVAPGCRRNESTVLSPLRWAVTSANPRPRTASARGTSAAGIFT